MGQIKTRILTPQTLKWGMIFPKCIFFSSLPSSYVMHKTWRLRVKSVCAQMKSPQMRAIIYRTSEVSICVFAFFCRNHKEWRRKQRDERVVKSCRMERERGRERGHRRENMTEQDVWHSEARVQCSRQVLVEPNLWDPFIPKDPSHRITAHSLQLPCQVFFLVQKSFHSSGLLCCYAVSCVRLSLRLCKIVP